ncbi:ribonuclease P protein component, partial [Candidatus Falkowbacteria bacterium]|nr:ribonuclease P protein component [Candidatus Falkowbacteria bacterium]
IGIMVGLKVSKSAVDRNKVRRWLRETIKQELPDIKNGFDIVILTNPKIKDKDLQEIKKALASSLKRAGLYR